MSQKAGIIQHLLRKKEKKYTKRQLKFASTV